MAMALRTVHFRVQASKARPVGHIARTDAGPWARSAASVHLPGKPGGKLHVDRQGAEALRLLCGAQEGCRQTGKTAEINARQAALEQSQPAIALESGERQARKGTSGVGCQNHTLTPCLFLYVKTNLKSRDVRQFGCAERTIAVTVQSCSPAPLSCIPVLEILPMRVLSLLLSLLLAGCTGLPNGVTPVHSFEIERYLGTWYEVARLDHSFERGLEQVSATYSLREDGGIRVLNRGFNPLNQQWKEAEGKAYPLADPARGHLKVSFFGPFYGSYAIFELDPDYHYAFVSGYNTDYLWLLSRTPEVSPQVLERFVQRSRELGFASDELIYVRQQ
jgi:apolipoprotein D and lipocalin family protein